MVLKYFIGQKTHLRVPLVASFAEAEIGINTCHTLEQKVNRNKCKHATHHQLAKTLRHAPTCCADHVCVSSTFAHLGNETHRMLPSMPIPNNRQVPGVWLLKLDPRWALPGGSVKIDGPTVRCVIRDPLIIQGKVWKAS